MQDGLFSPRNKTGEGRTMEKTDATSKRLDKFLEESAYQRYCVPFFQRQFEWRDEQLERFWADVDKVISDDIKEQNFLGAFVLQTKSQSASRTREYVVIDGQQRLTTIFLTLLACAEYADERGWKDWRYTDIQGRYLECLGDDEKGMLRLEPTPFDRRQFNEIFEKFSDRKIRAFPSPSGKPKGRITRAYDTCKKKLEEILEPNSVPQGHDVLKDFLDRFLGNTEIVCITLDADRNAHEIFDRLNNTGVRLRIIDMVRNEVFQKAATRPDDLYDEKWAPFEKELHDTFGKLRGIRKSRHIDDFFWQYALIQNDKAVKSRLFSELRASWKTLTDGADDSYDAACTIIDDLDAWLPAYFALQPAWLDLEVNTRPRGIDNGLWARIETLNDMPIHAATYPYLMRLIRAHIENPSEFSADNCIKCIDHIESFFIRRAVCGYQPAGMNKIFQALWARAEVDPKQVRENLETRTHVIPDDEKFRDGIIDLGLYKKSWDYFILREYEKSLWEGQYEAFKELPHGTIDHVMPQNLPDQWETEISDDDHAKYKDTWGNLVLLTKKLNSSKGNRTFEDAKALLKKHTIFKSTQEILEYDTWGIEQIQKRSEKIAEWAVNRWPFD